jgi:uncharacterized membrane protein YjgN (DUF898 family)
VILLIFQPLFVNLTICVGSGLSLLSLLQATNKILPAIANVRKPTIFFFISFLIERDLIFPARIINLNGRIFANVGSRAGFFIFLLFHPDVNRCKNVAWLPD